MAERLAGLEDLDQVLDDESVRLVLFSSVAGVWGGGGHGAVAVGAAHVAALAEQRRARGLPTTAIAWGPWDQGGPEAEENRRSGILPLDPAAAFAAFRQALDTDEASLIASDIDWPRFVDLFTVTRPSPLLSTVLDAEPRVQETAAADDGHITRLAGADPDTRRDELVEIVRKHTAAVLGRADAAEVDPTKPFRDLGFESMYAVELRNSLNTATGARLTATAVFDHPTPLALAWHIDAELFDRPGRDALDEALGLLESAIAASGPRPGDHTRIAERLRGLLAAWTGTGDPSADIGDASDDELFALIDGDFGRGATT